MRKYFVFQQFQKKSFDFVLIDLIIEKIVDFALRIEPNPQQLLVYIYQPIKMFAQQLEAQQNLRRFSQRTNYIVDWTQRPKDKHSKNLDKFTIPQDVEEEFSHTPTMKKNSSLSREASDKYNLKKCQTKLEIINQIEYPMIEPNIFRLQNYLVPSKRSVNPELTPFTALERRKSTNSSPCRVIDVQFLSRKLQIFQKKHTESQKNIQTLSQNTRNKPTPKGLIIKKNHKPPENKVQNIVLNVQELEKIKKMISKNSRRYSVPNIREIPQLAF